MIDGHVEKASNQIQLLGGEVGEREREEGRGVWVNPRTTGVSSTVWVCHAPLTVTHD